jgi:3-oxoacyl-[acyl-carrier protein] reductase
MQKTALVTGGNKGIGLEVTKAFLALGYDVIVLARDFKNFELSTHSKIKTIAFDLAQVDAIAALIASLPTIDILINNAGIMYAIPYQNYENDQINTMLKINLEAPVKLIEEVAKTIVWLATESPKYINGTVIDINNGSFPR